ncbi:MAG: tetratricopeptide repeat protein [Acidobacteriales bacterium]|nr:tetratricopeptide repeat protein [Terriglobales bacterium]
MAPKLRSIVLLAACFLAALSVAAQSTAAPDPNELVKQGRALNNQGKQDEALALYAQALKIQPDMYDAHLATGIALDLKGEYEEARKHIARAIELANPEQKGQALRTMGMSWAFVGNGKEAEKCHKQVYDAQMAKSDFVAAAETANELARVLLETGDLKGAQGWYELGHAAAFKKTDLKDSEKDLWEFRWEHAQARLAARRGYKTDAAKHVAAAKALFDKGTNPEQAPFVPYLVGYVAFYAQDYPTAIAELNKGNLKDPFILVLLAQAHENSGDWPKAKDYYRQALEFNNHNPTNAFARPLAKKKLAISAKPTGGSAMG